MGVCIALSCIQFAPGRCEALQVCETGKALQLFIACCHFPWRFRVLHFIMMRLSHCFRTAADDPLGAYEQTGTLFLIFCHCFHFNCSFSIGEEHKLTWLCSAGLRPSNSHLPSPLGLPQLTLQLQYQLQPRSTRHASSSASPEKAFQERVQEIRNACAEPYPRLAVDSRTLSCAEFRSRYAHLKDNESVEDDRVVVSGRSSVPAV